MLIISKIHINKTCRYFCELFKQIHTYPKQKSLMLNTNKHLQNIQKSVV